MTYLHSVERYRTAFTTYLETKIVIKEPLTLYTPITYISKLGGKRIRPILTLMATDFFGGNPTKAMDAALAIEMFHNFSLVHDDIMDAAPLRRGKPTVHKKWDVNTGILSGDALLIHAYQLFEAYEKTVFKNLVTLFSKTALEVCEGQRYDMDFERRSDVTLAEYLKMIEYKTAVLVATALKIGAIIARADKKDAEAMYQFGKNLGIAFQLQDDYLDVFGDTATFGKQTGGDIRENKKTFLVIQAVALASETQKEALLHWYTIQPKDVSAKIEAVKTIFLESGAVEETQKQIVRYTQKAFEVLELISAPDSKKQALKEFGESLITRMV